MSSTQNNAKQKTDRDGRRQELVQASCKNKVKRSSLQQVETQLRGYWHFHVGRSFPLNMQEPLSTLKQTKAIIYVWPHGLNVLSFHSLPPASHSHSSSWPQASPKTSRGVLYMQSKKIKLSAQRLKSVQIAIPIMELAATFLQENNLRQEYADWDKKVYQPIATKACCRLLDIL